MAFLKWTFMLFVVTPGIVFGPIALIGGIAMGSGALFALGLVVSSLAWGMLLKASNSA